MTNLMLIYLFIYLLFLFMQLFSVFILFIYFIIIHFYLFHYLFVFYFLFVCPIFNSHIIISLSELSESLLLWSSDISGYTTQYEMLRQMSGLEF